MLPRAERLRRNRDFKRVYAAKRTVVHPLMVLYSRPARVGRRIGFSVSSKLGGAVIRNRVKRRLREAIRGCLPVLSDSFDAILVARSRITASTYVEIAETVTEVFRKAGLVHCDLKPVLREREPRPHDVVEQSISADGEN